MPLQVEDKRTIRRARVDPKVRVSAAYLFGWFKGLRTCNATEEKVPFSVMAPIILSMPWTAWGFLLGITCSLAQLMAREGGYRDMNWYARRRVIASLDGRALEVLFAWCKRRRTAQQRSPKKKMSTPKRAAHTPP